MECMITERLTYFWKQGISGQSIKVDLEKEGEQWIQQYA